VTKQPRDRDVIGLRRIIAAVGGARLCYGKPIKAGDRVVIPVARVRSVGGFGLGQGPAGDGGGGGGGSIDAAPIGFIEIAPEQSRFEPIRDPAGAALAVRNAAAAIGVLAAAVMTVRRQRGRVPLSRGRRAARSPGRHALASPRRLLPR
jgi:uncharacterized spore protein YtfJ